tara:strand:+ start:2739 stop:3137 length:399 start_codon:yes stop_codon:yes gene_type:complete
MPRKVTRKSLIKRLDTIFSLYIRLRDADKNGFCTCITCKKKYHYKELDAGHFLSRRHFSVRYDTENVYSQCRYCNRYNAGQQYIYSIELEKKESGLPKRLLEKSKKTVKLSNDDLISLINRYKEFVKLMENN